MGICRSAAVNDKVTRILEIRWQVELPGEWPIIGSCRFANRLFYFIFFLNYFEQEATIKKETIKLQKILNEGGWIINWSGDLQLRVAHGPCACKSR